ncbi:MAG TPA: hypothetical protein VJ623_13720 [Holophagaceae bacterium]|nr:hypothetical protein [Holophagaceae bacterium]
MNPLFLLPALLAQSPAPGTPLPVVEAKDLPAAARGPIPPEWPDPGAESGTLGASRRMARRGPSIPALQLPGGSVRVKDKVPDISGWRAYAIEVPGKGSVEVEVVQGDRARFRVKAVNNWGREEEGMLQNRIWKGRPVASYHNPGPTPKTVYFIVDTTDANLMGEAFEAEVRRQ